MRFRNLRRMALLCAPLPMLALASCDSQTRGVLEPELTQASLLSGVLDGASSGIQGALSETLVLRAFPAREAVVTAVIDRNGGEIRAAEHMLVVPRFAVSEPTLFTMRVVPGMHIHVELAAERVSDGTRIRDFNEMLKLRLSYRNALFGSDDRLVSVYLEDGTTVGRRSRVEHELDRGNRFLDAKLWHFSGYAMALD